MAAGDIAQLDSLFSNAQQIYRAGEFDSARTLLIGLRGRAQQEGALDAEARAMTWLGLALWRLGNHSEAQRIGEQALEFKRRHGLTDQYYRSYNALGLLAWTENRFFDASRWFELTADAAEELGNRHAAATVLGNLALVQTELGQFQEARSGFLSMRETMAEVGDTMYEANSLSNLGMLEIRLGNPQGAVPVLNDALKLYESVEYGTGTQSALGQLGTAYAALGDPARAFSALDSALVIAKAQGLLQEQSSILEAMAEIYRGAGDFPRALDLYDSAQTINAKLGLDLETGIDLRGEADIHVRLGDLTRAQRLTEQALAIHRSAAAPLEELRDHLVLAEILGLLDEESGVEEHLRAAQRLADEVGARIARVEVGLAEARIADRRGQTRKVLEAIDHIRPDLTRGGYTAEWEARLLEARALEREGRYKEAAAAGRRALATVERVRGNFGSGMLRTAFVADKREVYAQLITVLLLLGELDEAFEVSDAARATVLREQLSAIGVGASEGADRTDALSQSESLLRQIDLLVGGIDFIEETPPAELTAAQTKELSQMYQRLEQARREYEGLLVHAQETDQTRAAFLGVARTDVQAVRGALEPRQLLIEYFVPTEGHIVIFVVSRDEIRVLESPVSAENLASRVRLARDLMSRSEAPSNRSDGVLAGLHEALIRPVIRAGLVSDVNELIIIPHDVLSYLPFGAVRDRTTERYLVEDYVIRTLPSAAALPVLSARHDGDFSSGDIAVFAPFPDELPGTRDEVRSIATAGRVRRFVGSRASEAALREALAQPRMVHVATHGVMNAMNPMFSRLELTRSGDNGAANDGRLEVHELLNLRIAAPLVFLSGCETGLGAARSTAFVPGEDYATLAQAFLYAGAGNVIATLWRVEDDGAAELAKRFYEELGHAGPAAALAGAQRWLLSQERYSAPYYWAAYQIAG